MVVFCGEVSSPSSMGWLISLIEIFSDDGRYVGSPTLLRTSGIEEDWPAIWVATFASSWKPKVKR